MTTEPTPCQLPEEDWAALIAQGKEWAPVMLEATDDPCPYASLPWRGH